MKLNKFPFFLVIILTLAGILRLWQVSTIPPGLFGDEVDTGYQAYSLLKTGRDYFGNFLPVHFQSFGDWRVPLYIYFDTLFVAVLGLNELAVRLPAAIIGLGGILASYFLAKKISGRQELALVTAFLLAVSPWHLQLSRIGLEVIFLSLLFPLALLFFWRSLKGQGWADVFLSALFFGLTIYAYNTAKLFTPLIFLLLSLLWWSDIKKHLKKWLVFVLFFGLLLVPFGRDLIKGTSQARFLGISILSDPGIPEKVRLERQNCTLPATLARLHHNKLTVVADSFVKNYLDAWSTTFLFGQGDPNPRHAVGGRGELYLFELPFLLAGLTIVGRNAMKRKDKFSQLFLGWLLLAPIPAALTLSGGTHALRLFILEPWLEMAVAWGMVEFWLYSRRLKYGKLLTGTLVVLISFSVLTYLHQYFVHYAKNSGRWWNYGYREIFDYVNRVEANYNQIYVSPSWEPSLVYTLFYSQYSPSLVQKEINISSSALGKYRFYSPDLSRVKRGEGDQKTLYIVNPAELAIAKLEFKDPNINFIRQINSPDNWPTFVIFSSKDVIAK